MIATSYGTGPFKPAIRWYDRLWICDDQVFDNEDEAAGIAEQIIEQLNSHAVEFLNAASFEPTMIGKRCNHDWQTDPTCDLIDVCSKCGEQRA